MKIPYGKQHIKKKDIDAVVSCLKSEYLTQGPKIQEFEEKFASFMEAKYAVAVSNGTAALHLSALALNVGDNSEVITTPISFVATSNCIKYCGGDVYFSDVDKDVILDVVKVQQLLKKYPKRFSGIIVVDFAGMAANMEKFRTIADEHNLWIIEDACHAPGGYFLDSKGTKQFCGNSYYSDLSVFSFHPVKHIACGEGGMITTNNKNLYEKIKTLRTHGIVKEKNNPNGGWLYEMQSLGFNYRLSDINAALGISQLSYLSENIKIRQNIAKKYDDAFKDTVIEPVHKNSEGHAYHLYTIKVPDRLGLYNFLKKQGIYVQVHYIPITQQPYYKNLKKSPFIVPVADEYYEKCLSIPIFPTLTIKEHNYVIEKIKDYF